MLSLQYNFLKLTVTLYGRDGLLTFILQIKVLADKLFFSKISQMVNGELTVYTLISAFGVQALHATSYHCLSLMLTCGMVYIAVES